LCATQAFVGFLFRYCPNPYYVRARELKAACMDWTEVLAENADNWRARLAAEIHASTAYQSTMDRVRAFQQRRGGCRATYFNHVRRLNGEGAAEKPTNGRKRSRMDDEAS
jgi:hypothetical protein